jgi:2-octaprenyl-3-methyl-6-methoxy-1,4-benzoquinol hydroxylase/2-octaprenylphenol hydroxylase
MSRDASSNARARRRPRRSGEVIIAGGGMVGTAAALALAHIGLDVTLVEAHAPRPWQREEEMDLRVVALAPSSARLLDQLDLWRTLATERIHPYTHMHVWDSASGAALDFDAADMQSQCLGWIVENRMVQYRLWQAAQTAGVDCLCPARVTSFENFDDHVHVGLDDGSSRDARVLIAADGGASPLRQIAGIETHRRAYAQRGVVAHVGTERVHQDTAWQRFLPGGPVALLPLADGRSSIVWTLPDAEADKVLGMDDQAFADAVGVASDFRLGRITGTTQRAAFPLQLQLAAAYQSGRMVLLGDAAHVVHPLAGQGANLGLRDVAELRDVFAAALEAGRDPGAPSVLARYARRRRSADTLDARAFDALGRIFAWQAPGPVAMRGAGMAAIARLAPARRLLMQHAMGLGQHR